MLSLVVTSNSTRRRFLRFLERASPPNTHGTSPHYYQSTRRPNLALRRGARVWHRSITSNNRTFCECIGIFRVNPSDRSWSPKRNTNQYDRRSRIRCRDENSSLWRLRGRFGSEPENTTRTPRNRFSSGRADLNPPNDVYSAECGIVPRRKLNRLISKHRRRRHVWKRVTYPTFDVPWFRF